MSDYEYVNLEEIKTRKMGSLYRQLAAQRVLHTAALGGR